MRFDPGTVRGQGEESFQEGISFGFKFHIILSSHSLTKFLLFFSISINPGHSLCFQRPRGLKAMGNMDSESE